MRGIDKSGVLITGGCGDIGLAVARRFLQAGARVMLADVMNLEKGAALLKKKLNSRNAGFVCQAQWIDEQWPFAENLLIAE